MRGLSIAGHEGSLFSEICFPRDRGLRACDFGGEACSMASHR